MNADIPVRAVALIAAIVCSTVALADTSVATKWRLVGATQGDCLNLASTAIRGAGFDLAGPGSQTTSGKKGEYTASIRCVSEQNIVFFVLSGPSPDITSRYIDVLYRQFR